MISAGSVWKHVINRRVVVVEGVMSSPARVVMRNKWGYRTVSLMRTFVLLYRNISDPKPEQSEQIGPSWEILPPTPLEWGDLSW